MEHIILRPLLAGVLLASASTAGAQPLTVHIRDFTRIHERKLERAQRHAARVLKTAGVELTWVTCRNGSEGACPAPPDPTEFIMDLLPAGTTRGLAGPTALGYALQPDSGSFASNAGVLYDRVQRLDSGRASETILLGHAIAHELGHLLLGPGRHSAAGIMKADWNSRDLELAGQGRLAFHSEERRHIQANVQRRLAEARKDTLARSRTP
jgi:hypothetical protein